MKTWVNLIPWILAGLPFFFAASWCAVHTNKNITHADQSAVVLLSMNIKESGNPLLTDANRHPLFPLLLSPFASWTPSGFATGKLFAAFFFLLLFALFFFLFRNAPFPLHALLATILVLPSGLPLMAVQVIPDGLFTCLLLLALAFLTHAFDSSKNGFLGGLFAGLAFLTKQSGLMVLPLFLFIAFCRFVYITRISKKSSLSSLRPLVFAILGFFLFTSPFFIQNGLKHGNPLYNVNSQYYLWADSWAHAQSFSGKINDRENASVRTELIKNLPQDSILSFKSYFRRHSVGFALYRLKAGVKMNLNMALKHRTASALLCTAIILAWGVLFWKRKEKTHHPFLNPPSLFLLSFLLFYFLSISWYAAVALNIRYYLPFHASLVLFIGLLFKTQDFSFNKKVSFLVYFLLLISLFLTVKTEHHLLTFNWEKLKASADCYSIP